MNEYDIIAEKYDTLFADNNSKHEDTVVGRLIGDFKGIVCDVGCGTGLLVELCHIDISNYIGIDPSKKMLDKFRKKHYGYQTIPLTFEDWYDKWDGTYKISNFVSLYGSISYVRKEYVKKLAEANGVKFLMFYADDYVPYTHTVTGINPAFYTYTREELQNLFGNVCYVYRYNNYFIVQSI